MYSNKTVLKQERRVQTTDRYGKNLMSAGKVRERFSFIDNLNEACAGNIKCEVMCCYCMLTQQPHYSKQVMPLLFLLQVIKLCDHRQSLCLSGFSAANQPFPLKRAGPELQSSWRRWSNVAVCCFEGSTLYASETQVMLKLKFVCKLRLYQTSPTLPNEHCQ